MKRFGLLGLFGLVVCSPVLAAEGEFDSNGIKIHYVTEGQGEAVVLIHGWQSDSTMWGRDSAGNTKLSPAPGFQVIALDCRGHGKSGKPHDANKYGAEMAADVIRLLDHLKIKRAHLLGYSMGAFIVGKVVATHPQRVISAIYGGQAPLLVGESGSKEIDAFAKAVEEGKGMGPYLVEVSPPYRKPTLEQANAYGKFLYDGKDLWAFALAGKSFGGLEVKLEDLKKAKIPTLLIYGSKEGESTKMRIANLQKNIASEEKVIDGADHSTTLVKPEFGASIVAFLNAHKS